jgi:hypothetical protein
MDMAKDHCLGDLPTIAALEDVTTIVSSLHHLGPTFVDAGKSLSFLGQFLEVDEQQKLLISELCLEICTVVINVNQNHK